jgi:predicted molibdopterin-dependent oxidoreductase YjgC
MRVAIPKQFTKGIMNGRLVRAIVPSGPPVRILVDGAEVTAYAGESVLVAVLAARNALRQHEFSDEARAGFCLMGACQDCWVWLADGRRVRACTTVVSEAMQVSTGAPQEFLRHD